MFSAVDGGERAVMYDRIQGVLDDPVGEGTHFRVPWFQTPNVMDIRTRPRSISSVTGTKGGWRPTAELRPGSGMGRQHWLAERNPSLRQLMQHGGKNAGALRRPPPSPVLLLPLPQICRW